MQKNVTKKLAIRGLLIALAFGLSWLEAQIPYPFPLPGMKIGLSNLVVLIALYKLSDIDALLINIARILLVGLLFTNIYSISFSLVGGIVSYLVMCLLKNKTKLDIKFVSVAGGISHNVGQIILSMIILENAGIIWYLPFLWISGIVAGILVGIACELVIKRMPVNLLLIVLVVMSTTLTACSSPFPKTYSSQLFAMDTFMTVEAYGTKSKEAVDEAFKEIERLDALWSVGLHNSEISQINRSEVSSVSEDTADLLGRISLISDETKGAIDITIYPLMELWGFTDGNTRVPSDEEIKDCLKKVSYLNIEFDEKDNHIALSSEASIDLGAVAKGYASDKVVSILKDNGIKSANINLGGNVYALGCKPDGSLWKIGIENPRPELDMFNALPYLGVLSVHDKAVVTSGDYHRFFTEGDERYHHIMNPFTGYPSKSGLMSVTVVSEDGTFADALSTALFVMGKEKALSYWKEHSNNFDTILVESNGSITITIGLKDIFKSDLEYSVYE